MGLATKKVKDILKEANLEGEFHMYPWARAYDYAKSNPGTLLYSIAKNSERDKHFEWIAPIARFRLAFISLSDKQIELKDRADLFKYSVTVQRDDIAHSWLQAQGLVEKEHFLLCADILCSWDLLLKGNVDLIIDDPLLAEQMMLSMGKSPELIKVVAPIPSLDIVGYLAISKGGDKSIMHRLRGASIKLEQSK